MLLTTNLADGKFRGGIILGGMVGKTQLGCGLFYLVLFFTSLVNSLWSNNFLKPNFLQAIKFNLEIIILYLNLEKQEK